MSKNFYTIDTYNKMIRFYFPKNDKIRDDLRGQFSECHWNPSFNAWIVPYKPFMKDLIISFVKKYGFEFKSEEQKSFPKYDHSVNEVTMSKMIEVCENRKFTYQPRPYQYEALYYALQKHSFINGDDVGLGKTMEAIMYTEVLRAFPVIVIVPASVKYNWGEKWSEIVGEHRTVSVIESASKKNNWDADVVIINYDILGKKQGNGVTLKFDELFKKWKMYIFDEIHFCKESKSMRTKAARLLVKQSNDPVQGLTGTAIMSKPAELWSILRIIRREKYIAPNERDFQFKYCGAYKSKFGMVTTGATNTLELNSVLRETCYLRREKREVLKDMPPVTTEILDMKITNIKDINNAQNDLYDFLLKTKGFESAEKAMEAESLVILGVLRKLSIVGKLKAITQYLDDWLLTGKKLVIFGLHREELDFLAERYKSDLIAGGVTAKKKQDIVKRWIEDDKPFLFANISSAGTGVDGLQNVCSNMLILELPWRPSDLVQTIARIDRSGQTEPCNVRFALSQLTIDLEMWDMIGEKEITAEAVNKGIDITNEESGMKIVMRKFLENQRKKKKV